MSAAISPVPSITESSKEEKSRHFSGNRLIRDAQPEYDPLKGPPPNYLATIEPEFARSRLQSGIWQSFGPAQVLRKWL